MAALAAVVAALAAELASLALPPRRAVWSSAVRFRWVPAASLTCWGLGLPGPAWALGLGTATSLAVLAGTVAWLATRRQRMAWFALTAVAAAAVYVALAAACLPLALVGVHQAAAAVHARKTHLLRAAL